MKRFLITGCLLISLIAAPMYISGCATMTQWRDAACDYADVAKERLRVLKSDLEAIRQALAVILPADASTYIPGVGLVDRNTINALFQAIDMAILGANILIEQACPPMLQVDNLEQQARQLVDSQPTLQHIRRQLSMKRL